MEFLPSHPSSSLPSGQSISLSQNHLKLMHGPPDLHLVKPSSHSGSPVKCRASEISILSAS